MLHSMQDGQKHGLFSILQRKCALFVNGIFGMILGIAGLVVSSRSKSMGYNDSLRTAGFVLSVLSVVLGGITLVACIACTAGLGILGASLY